MNEHESDYSKPFFRPPRPGYDRHGVELKAKQLSPDVQMQLNLLDDQSRPKLLSTLTPEQIREVLARPSVLLKPVRQQQPVLPTDVPIKERENQLPRPLSILPDEYPPPQPPADQSDQQIFHHAPLSSRRHSEKGFRGIVIIGAFIAIAIFWLAEWYIPLIVCVVVVVITLATEKPSRIIPTPQPGDRKPETMKFTGITVIQILLVFIIICAVVADPGKYWAAIFFPGVLIGVLQIFNKDQDRSA